MAAQSRVLLLLAVGCGSGDPAGLAVLSQHRWGFLVGCAVWEKLLAGLLAGVSVRKLNHHQTEAMLRCTL